MSDTASSGAELPPERDPRVLSRLMTGLQTLPETTVPRDAAAKAVVQQIVSLLRDRPADFETQIRGVIDKLVATPGVGYEEASALRTVLPQAAQVAEETGSAQALVTISIGSALITAKGMRDGRIIAQDSLVRLRKGLNDLKLDDDQRALLEKQIAEASRKIDED